MKAHHLARTQARFPSLCPLGKAPGAPRSTTVVRRIVITFSADDERHIVVERVLDQSDGRARGYIRDEGPRESFVL